MSNFEMNIDLGNVAMATRGDIAQALRAVADRVLDWNRTGSQPILDHNGNTVGSWELSEDTDDEDESEDDGQGDDAWADSDTLASAGYGTDEDYGFYGGDDY